MALPGPWLAELRSRTPIVALIGRKVRLRKHGKEWLGLCPFHGEKSPSFYVYEGDDPHFHCFGCGAHGDAISFVMQSTGAVFRDVVAELAAKAGMEVPTGPALAAAEQHRKGLHQILEQFGADGVARLWSPEGAAALNYLRGRGLTDETIRTWGLGWIGRAALPERAVEAGLARQDEDRIIPLFFDRVLFPIKDHLGRIISFSGRVLNDRKPKYINGADSELFSKSRSLFGIERLRAGVAAGQTPIVMEGQFDVTTAQQAGILAVAPMGSALTEDHLDVLWKACPAPVICFDGDEAGRRATRKVLDQALPYLTPNRTLRFATLPHDEDPDQFIKRRGAQAFLDAMIRPAKHCSTMLYDVIRAGATLGTPEGEAAFRIALEDAARRINHVVLRREYQRSLIDRLYEERRAVRNMWRNGPARVEPPVATDSERIRQLAEVGSQIVEATAAWSKDPSEQNGRRLRAFIEARNEIMRGDHAAPPSEELQ